MKRLRELQSSLDIAHIAPLIVFMGFLVVLELLRAVGFSTDDDAAVWFRREPAQWVFPLQTVVTLGVLFFFRRQYDFRPANGLGLAVVAGFVGIVIWLAPGWIYQTYDFEPGILRYVGFAPRTDGFDPTFIRQHSALWYAVAVGFRFIRMVVVVALAEEIFWRGFLMRYLIDMDGDHWEVPFGTFSWTSLVVVTTAFIFAHAPVDFIGALTYGLLAYFVAVRTKSLTACIVMHAVANLLLGIYVMYSQQWGYW